MRNGKIRRFRPRSNRYHSRRPNTGIKSNNGVYQLNNQKNHFSRNSTSKNPYNLEKIIEKYKNLAKEALSGGDKILYENYLQHAEHFIRNSSNFSNGNAAKNGHSQGADETNVSKINKEDFKQEDKLEEKKS